MRQPPTPEQLAAREERAAARRARRNAKRREQRADPDRLARIADARRKRAEAVRARTRERQVAEEKAREALIEGRVLHMLELIEKGGGAPLFGKELRALGLGKGVQSYWHAAHAEARKTGARLAILENDGEPRIVRCDVNALAGGAA